MAGIISHEFLIANVWINDLNVAVSTVSQIQHSGVCIPWLDKHSVTIVQPLSQLQVHENAAGLSPLQAADTPQSVEHEALISEVNCSDISH